MLMALPLLYCFCFAAGTNRLTVHIRECQIDAATLRTDSSTFELGPEAPGTIHVVITTETFA